MHGTKHKVRFGGVLDRDLVYKNSDTFRLRDPSVNISDYPQLSK